MPEVVGVRFRKSGKIYDFDPQSLELKPGDHVVVETVRGAELGEIAMFKPNCNPEPDTLLKPVLRLATKEDVERAGNLPPKEEEALKECNKLVAKLELPMKLISAEYNLDASHLTVFFGAENRVDFRELVRELSHHLKVRVELRQIGPRDEAKLLGGFGRCGRELCCASFLTEFNPVSIKMAKVQDLPLNPLKISGVCGRLLCCLGYECEQYRQMKEKMPREGVRVMTDAGPGIIVGSNTLAEKVLVEYETGARMEVPVGKVKLVSTPVQSSVPPSSTPIIPRVGLESPFIDKLGEDTKKPGP
jgi:cell fate regulator YaaT (PSP1 superfamily)